MKNLVVFDWNWKYECELMISYYICLFKQPLDLKICSKAGCINKLCSIQELFTLQCLSDVVAEVDGQGITS